MRDGVEGGGRVEGGGCALREVGRDGWMDGWSGFEVRMTMREREV
jgi:hypothetical protein